METGGGDCFSSTINDTNFFYRLDIKMCCVIEICSDDQCSFHVYLFQRYEFDWKGLLQILWVSFIDKYIYAFCLVIFSLSLLILILLIIANCKGSKKSLSRISSIFDCGKVHFLIRLGFFLRMKVLHRG